MFKGKVLETTFSFQGTNVPVYLSPWPITLKNEKGEILNFDCSFRVTYLVNLNKKLFYFSGDHSTPKNLKGDGWVPVTTNIPSVVVPRESLPTGFVTCLNDMVKIFLHDCHYKGVI